MANVTYVLGAAVDLERLYPPPKFADPALGFRDYCDVIEHYTHKSTTTDGLLDASVDVRRVDSDYEVHIESGDPQDTLDRFAERHRELFSSRAGLKAVRGKQRLEELGVWNPMAGYPVNTNAGDGECKWHLFPPLGLNVINQKAVLLMHYPPWAVLHEATFTNSITWTRWNTVLLASGLTQEQANRCQTIVDVNPIAAPGSGQSEYANDYFPTMMASGFFDGGPDRDYIRSMLELYLNPPGNEANEYTLPLLVCGSPLYDPQAALWFRTAYKDTLPKDTKTGEVLSSVLQAGTFRVRPESAKETPYMVANHMIAAGVMGLCTNDPTTMPNICLFEAQDLTAATFLTELINDPKLSPADAKARACTRWFGNAEADPRPSGPAPADHEDQMKICALAQMDLFFEPKPAPHSKFTLDEALDRCRNATAPGKPCAGSIKPERNLFQCPETEDALTGPPAG